MKVVTIISVMLEFVTKLKLSVLLAVIGDAGTTNLKCMAWLLLNSEIPERTGWTLKLSAALTCSRVFVVSVSLLMVPMAPLATVQVLSM